MTKKLLAVLFCSTLILVFPGCSKKDKPTDTQNAASAIDSFSEADREIQTTTVTTTAAMVPTAPATTVTTVTTTTPVATAAPVTSKAPVTTKTPITTTAPPISKKDFLAEVVRLVNAEREKVGLNTLVASDSLNNAAEIRANEIVTSFSHTRPGGTVCFTVLE